MCHLHSFQAPVHVYTKKTLQVTPRLFYTSLSLVFHLALLPMVLQTPVFYEVQLCHMGKHIPFRHWCTVRLPNQIPHRQNPVTENMPHQNRSSVSSLIQVIVKSTDTQKTSLIIMFLGLDFLIPSRSSVHSKSKKW